MYKMSALCAVCGKTAAKLCSACKNVAYCCAEHQKKDWKIHKSVCRIYLIKKNEVLGRYIVASRDIPPGTVIIDEPAVMIGPKQDSLPICLGCHKRVDGSYFCSKCSLPICNKECEQIPIHAENECKIFKNLERFKIRDFSKHHPIYECILTLRCLLLQDKNPLAWEKLNAMEHHNALRQENAELWNRNEVNTVNFLRNFCQMDFEPMTIHSVLGYADINAFEIKAEGIEICGLFPAVSLMAHDCVSNTHHSITDDYRMIVRSTVTIQKGEIITTTYTHTLEGTLERREHIQDSKLFSCCCKRCSSPTELGTHLSSVKCLSCDIGYLLPKDPLNLLSLWLCNKCDRPESVDAIRALVRSIQDEIEEIQKDGKKNPIPRLEAVLKDYCGTKLHPNHFLMIGVYHSLSQYYGRIKDYTMEELTIDQLQRKEQVCRQLLQVIDVIEPGMSRIRGHTLYELHAAIFFSAKHKFKSGEMDKEQLQQELETVLNLLSTSMTILLFDSPSSITGIIAATIPESMEGVRQILQHFCGKLANSSSSR